MTRVHYLTPNSSDVCPPVPNTVAQLRAIPNAFPEDFPDDIAESLLAYARAERLEISPRRQEVIPLYFSRDDRFMFFLGFDAFKRKARETGRWLPGKVTFEGAGLELVAQATSWFRSTDSGQWVEGGGVVIPFWSYYSRSHKSSSSPSPLWQLDAHRLLATIAIISSIYEALNDIMTQYLVIEAYPTHDDDPHLHRFFAGEMSLGEYRKRQCGIVS